MLELAEAPAGPGLPWMWPAGDDALLWDVAWPRPEGPWPLRLVHRRSGEVAYGTYDPADGVVRRIRPEDDAALPALRQLLPRGRLVAYRPGRRATVRLDGSPPVYAKALRPARTATAARRFQAVAAAVDRHPGAPSVPALVHEDPGVGLLLFREVPGRSLHDDAAPRALDRVAAALVALHEIDAAGLHLPPGGGVDLGHYVRLAADAVPGRAAILRAGLQQVAALPSDGCPPSPCLVHGDLHDKNVLRDETRVTLLDVDLAHAGDPAEDVGNLGAHLALRSLQRGDGLAVGRRRAAAFGAAYRAAGGHASAEAVGRSTARTLLRLACLYQFRRRWQHLTPDLAEEAVRWARELRP